MKLAVEQKILQAVVNYLETKPYREVQNLISMLLNSKPIEEKKEE